MSRPDQRPDRSRLEALRDLLEAALTDPETAKRDLASLSREYRMTVAALGAGAPSSEVSKLDEIAARRAKRGAS